jgi:hypothetical protein
VSNIASVPNKFCLSLSFLLSLSRALSLYCSFQLSERAYAEQAIKQQRVLWVMRGVTECMNCHQRTRMLQKATMCNRQRTRYCARSVVKSWT